MTDRTRTVIAAQFICRCCGHEEVRHFFCAKDYNHDIRAQNLLCMRCYLDGKFDPATLIPHEQLPVIPYPEHR